MTDLLVLWDIDHTLMQSGPTAHDAYAAAFQRATGRILVQPWRFDGRTELAAATEVLQAHGLAGSESRLEEFLGFIVAEFLARAGELAATGRALPGAIDSVAAVRAVAGVHQSVLTGNLLPLAELKLATFGLAEHIDLRLGAYGSDAFERTDLPNHAFARAQRQLGRRFDGATTVIVGDTVRDIQTAHAAGAKAIAVATGTTSAADLHTAGADIVLPDLADTAAVLKAITGIR
jgi:phosphoglycolate phosphatase